MGRFLFVSLILLFVALSLVGVKGGCCPHDWLPMNGFCYKVFEEEKNWANAEKFCMNHKPGCHLASIHCKTESDDLAEYLKDYLRTKKHVWIGLYDKSKVKLLTETFTRRPWNWTDRSPTDYFAWNRGEPNNIRGNENCVHLLAFAGYKYWNDQSCNEISPFMCQCRY